MSANNEQANQQDDLFGGLFDGPSQQVDPIWGDRFIKKDRTDANVKPYGRPNNPIMDAKSITFDVDAAKRERDKAVDRSNANADPAWREAYFGALVDVARVKEYFTADDIWERLAKVEHAANTRDNRAAGGCITRAKRDGVIRLTDRVEPSRRKHCHQMIQRVYQSLIYGQPDAHPAV
jgi:hypothetical protein